MAGLMPRPTGGFMTGTIRRTVVSAELAFGLVFAASAASAQSGQIKGKITDAQGQPIEGAEIKIENIDKGARALTVKSNKKGEYIQVGLYPGMYNVTASKGELSS